MTKKLSFKILFLIFSLSVVILLTAMSSKSFSDFFSDNIASVFRLSLGALASIIPFSLGETLVIAAVFFAITFVISFFVYLFCLLRRKKSYLFKKLLLTAIIIAMTIFILFVFTFGVCYHRSSLFELMELDASSVDSDAIGKTLEMLVLQANIEAKKINLSNFYNKLSISGTDFYTMSKNINYAADKLADKNSFLQNYGFPAKPISLSFIMTYTHISGVYSFFTGESNININYPEYVVVYTTAHEYAHQRGIASENEANFIAFLICMESDIPYIRYSGLLNMISKLSSNYYSINSKDCSRIMSMLSDDIKGEYKLYSEFFEKYSDNKASDISDKVNDSYLKLNGKSDGTKSYNDITLLITSYYLKYYL